MVNPWDPPPFPKQGNRSHRTLYESVGRALTTWEDLETYMASLYAAFCGKSCYDQKANNAYGEPSNFSQRITKLRNVADSYFTKLPPSVPTTMRQTPAGSLALRAEVYRSDGYACFDTHSDPRRLWR